MKVALEKTFPMPVSIDTAWAFLQNIEGVAGCVPGARITEHVDATHYRGTIAVRMGPASLSFKGEIEVLELDASRRTLRLIGKGSDSSGTSAASMDLTARIEPGADTTSSALIGKSEVSMSGKAAAFGGRMMNTVADQILKQFAANFAVEARKLAVPTASQAHAAAQSKAALQANAAAEAQRNAEPSLEASFPSNEASQSASALRLAGSSASGLQASSPGISASASSGPARSSTNSAYMSSEQVPLSGNTTSAAVSQESEELAGSIPVTGGLPPAKQSDVMAVQPLHPSALSNSADIPPMQLSVASTTPAAKANELNVASSAPPARASELNVISLLWAIVRDWIRGIFKRDPA